MLQLIASTLLQQGSCYAVMKSSASGLLMEGEPCICGQYWLAACCMHAAEPGRCPDSDAETTGTECDMLLDTALGKLPAHVCCAAMGPATR